MRILILVDCEVTSANSASALVDDLAWALCERRHEVVVAFPVVGPLEASRFVQAGRHRWLQVRSPRTKEIWRFTRGMSEALLPYRMWWGAKGQLAEFSADLVVYYSPTIFWAPLVKRLRRTHQCRTYLVLRDIFPQWALDAGVLSHGPAYLALKAVERAQYRLADVIGVQSPKNLDYFKSTRVTKGKRIEVLYNWVRPVRVDGTGEWRRKLGLGDRVTFVYGGNMGVAQDMDNVLRLAAALPPSRSHFVLVGRGSEVARLQAAVLEKGLSNVAIIPPLERLQFLALVADSDVGLISLDRRLSTHNIPGKLLSYLNCGKPVLASVNDGNDLRQIVEGAGAGVVVTNGDDAAFHAAAQRMVDDLAWRQACGENGGRLLVEHFSAEAAARQIEAGVC